jgi:tetratricopeptide (TPR) repeat protein
MELLNNIIAWLDWPLAQLGLNIPSMIVWWLYRIIVVALLFLFLKWILGFVVGLFQRDNLADTADIDALLKTKGGGTEQQQAANLLVADAASMKKNKQYDLLAETYAKAQKHKDAAKWYLKAKNPKEAAQEYAKMGDINKAAKLMLKGGDFLTAGLFYLEKQKYIPAAKAFLKGGNYSSAAKAYSEAGKTKEAYKLFLDYFSNPNEDLSLQVDAASHGLKLIESEDGKKKLTEDEINALRIPLGKVFEQNRQHDVAGKLYLDAKNFERAGQVYLLGGKLEQAVQCMKLAGKEKEANRIGGQYYEKLKKWKEAGMAYAGAEEFFKAGDCFVKAGDFGRAGDFYAKAQRPSRAGHAFAKGGQFEKAIAQLQQVPEDDKDFENSRALLGHSFYEIHDYAHCVAALENHLLNKRVDNTNIEYFYMLALAHEQIGNLQKSRDILYTIGAVNRGFRDLDQRISSIDSRISLMGGADSVPVQNVSSGTGNREMMTMVSNSLGERYILDKELGRGGMGVVYLAKDKQLDRKVALKFLGTLVDQSEEFRQRFIREARTAAKINHPNIVSIYDISASEGKAYIAMEFVEGPSLFQLIQKKKTLEPREALNYMVQTCGALQAIHDSGIVHRDIKPDNIVIAKGGLVKLMDFGLAKQEDNRLTNPNMVMGTPSYMAPEQAMGKEVDGRADLYAMGLVLYEMLTGEVVFLTGDVIKRQVSEMPEILSKLKAELPEALDAIAHKLIAKDPADRYQTGDEVIAAIRAINL